VTETSLKAPPQRIVSPLSTSLERLPGDADRRVCEFLHGKGQNLMGGVKFGADSQFLAQTTGVCTSRHDAWRSSATDLADVIVQSSLDYAQGKKHNVVVKKPDAMDPVETGVFEMADDLNRFFGAGSFADTTLGVFGMTSNTKRRPTIRLLLVSGIVTFDARLGPDAPGFRICCSEKLRGGRMLLFTQIHDARKSGRGGKGHEI
jgi:hypothetical protein